MNRSYAQAHLNAMMEFLVEQRVCLGLSQTEVAAAIGTSQRRLSRLENGANVNVIDLIRYADAVGAAVLIEGMS
jgi:transcriptional regulator with XRE-family HTH domain